MAIGSAECHYLLFLPKLKAIDCSKRKNLNFQYYLLQVFHHYMSIITLDVASPSLPRFRLEY